MTISPFPSVFQSKQDRSDAIATGEEEKKTDVSNNCLLFFGCRNHDEQIYREKLEDWEYSRVLDLHLALSRSSDRPRMYVQNIIQEKGQIVADLLLRDGSTYYVCGDAAMADSCHDAIIEALREHANMSRVMAVNFLKRMRMENRWQNDIWGISAYIDEDNFSTAKKVLAKQKSNRALHWLSSMKRKNSQILGDAHHANGESTFNSSARQLLPAADDEHYGTGDY